VDQVFEGTSGIDVKRVCALALREGLSDIRRPKSSSRATA
jgi:hypothetical protein